jgi:hypothetical protein
VRYDELPSGPRRNPRFGFNDNSVRAGQLSPTRAAALADTAGAEVIRLGFDWRYAEFEPDRYELGEYDAIYKALRSRGIKPLWVVVFAPAWALEKGRQCLEEATCRFPPARRADRHWREIVALLAERYPESAGIEVWNEQNLSGFWQPRPEPKRYAQLLKQAYTAVKKVDRDMPVVLGGLNNIQGDDGQGSIAMESYLRAVYENGGTRAMDAISFHPYAAVRTDPVFEQSVLQVLNVREEFGDRRRPLWVTEIGATTSGTESDLRWSPREQADLLVEEWERLRRVPGVEMVLVHTLLDASPDRSAPAAGFGLLGPDGAPKPAFCALRRAVTGRRC